jgi:Ca2+-binding RTX toxin-like protein
MTHMKRPSALPSQKAAIDDELLIGTDNNDTIYGNNGADTLYGGAGDDQLYGDDALNNYVNPDVLYGEAGNDKLYGGKGNDFLSGGAGSDTYYITTYGALDTIDNFDTGAASVDTVAFSNLKLTDIEYVARDGDDMVIHFRLQTGITQQEVTIKNQFADADHQIDVLQFDIQNATLMETYTLRQFLDIIPVRLSEGNDMQTWTDFRDYIQAAGGDDVLYLRGGNDQALGQNGNDSLYGEAGNDRLSGDAGNDLLDGGIGNDTLTGGAGNDTFVLRVGAGQDVLEIADTVAGRVDTIQFDDVASNGIRFVNRVGFDMVIGYGIDDTTTIKSYFSAASFEFNQIAFSDGATWSAADFLSHYAIQLSTGNDVMNFSNNAETIYAGAGADSIAGLGGDDQLFGEAGNDTLGGGDGNDSVDGGDGNDVVSGAAGDDVLSGGAGIDQLNSGAGNDTLDGGSGNDQLAGDVGNDVYIVRAGSGNDTINNSDTLLTHDDVLRFEGIASDQLVGMRFSGTNLIIDYGSGDSATITGYFSGVTREITHFEFADGIVFDKNALFAHYAVHGAAAAETLTATSASETIYAGGGNDTMAGQDGNDALFGEDGADNLSGGNGDDTLDGGAGNDFLNGGTGNDVYVLRAGSGTDSVTNVEATSNHYDVLRFEGIVSTGLTSVQHVGSNLVISYGAGDKVTVNSQFTTTGQIAEVQFADQSLTVAQLLSLYGVAKASPAQQAAEIGPDSAQELVLIGQQELALTA